MEPRIQFAKTRDGVNIAFWTAGEGMPFVGLPALPFATSEEWRLPEHRGWYARVAEKRKIVLYDGRGTGLSQRDVKDFSLDAQILDLEAVVDHLGLVTFALAAPAMVGPVGIAYAGSRPERLSHLLLWCAWARAADVMGSPQFQAMLSLKDQDWEIFTETAAHVLLGWSAGERARQAAAAYRESVGEDTARAILDAMLQFDATGYLPQITSPTLVCHRRQLVFPARDIATGLVSKIPNARLVLLDGATLLPYEGDVEAAARAIDEFLGEGAAASAATVQPPAGMAVIMFADIVDSTELTERMGDAAFREKARDLDGALRAAIREREGAPVEGKLLGDGVLAVFSSARQAIEAALRCGEAGEVKGLPLHLGVHAGDVIREEQNVYGGAVNIAARISAASEPGEVLVSETVRGLARTSADVAFEDRGEHELKGVADPLRLFAVQRGDVHEARRPSDALPEAPATGGLDEPPIQYAETADGVRIAFSVIGDGRPIVFMPQYPWSHIQKDWEMPAFRGFWTGAARTMRVIRYDARGTGLSDRGVDDLAPQAHLRDLHAVVQSLGLQSFALSGATSAGPLAIEYAGRHPDRVSHLVLWCTSARTSDIYPAGSEALDQMALTDWHFFTEAIAHSAFSWLHGEEAKQMAEFLRSCIAPGTLVASMPAFRKHDATPYLSSIAARTLVMTRRETPYLGVDVARRLASQIRGARLVVVEGSSIAPVGNEAAVLDVVSEFVGEDGQEPAGREVADRPISLTARETEVLSLLSSGCSGKEIAAQLTVSLSTVQRHIANIYAKIGARGRVEAAAYAIRHGLVPPRDA
ncbi:MAG: alpha/beta fold hydrolase [Dehalococcoidia bacterium]